MLRGTLYGMSSDSLSDLWFVFRGFPAACLGGYVNRLFGGSLAALSAVFVGLSYLPVCGKRQNALPVGRAACLYAVVLCILLAAAGSARAAHDVSFQAKSSQAESSQKSGSEDPERAYFELVFRQASERFGIPPGILSAVARQESSYEPLLLNIAGKDVRPRTRSEALSRIAEAEARGLGYDVGVMQINRYWIRKWKISPAVVLNPTDNIFLGALILAKEMKRYGKTWEAVGHYHSHTPARAEAYARKIQKHWEDVYGKARSGAACRAALLPLLP